MTAAGRTGCGDPKASGMGAPPPRGPYCPRRPDLDEVAVGFTFGCGGEGGGRRASLAAGAARRFGPAFREKSGIDRFPFFFIGTSVGGDGGGPDSASAHRLCKKAADRATNRGEMTDHRPPRADHDPDAERRFLQLVRDHERSLWGICRAYERDPEARRDLYQDVLVELWRSLPSFTGASSPGTWLYRVALNTALGHRRRRARAPEAVEADADLGERVADHRPGPADRLDRLERVDRLHDAIDRLGEVDRALVAMYLDERSYREMAEVLGISEGNVGVRLNRVRKTLGAMLEEV